MANAIQTSLGFLESTLSGDATFAGYLNGIFTAVAPQGTLPDWCILQPQSSQRVLNAYGVLVLTQGIYQVKVVGPEDDYANLYNAYNRMQTLIGLVRPSSGSYGSILACYQEQDLYVQELVAGVQYINLGGLFRVEV